MKIQGRLDLSKFRAESRFGAQFCKENTDALDGYHILATPLVSLMQRSEHVSSFVSGFVRPWLTYSLDATLDVTSPADDFSSWFGALVHWSGVAVTGGVGKLAKSVFGYKSRFDGTCSLPLMSNLTSSPCERSFGSVG